MIKKLVKKKQIPDNEMQIQLQNKQISQYESAQIFQISQCMFKITKQIIKKTGKSIDQIKKIIQNTKIPDYCSKRQNEELDHIRICFMCLFKQKSGSIRYYGYNKFNILKQIVHATFQNTIYMNISSNELCNIQDFQYLKVPRLLTLQLYGNKIVNMGPFAKNNWLQKLHTLTIYSNKINQISKFSRAVLKNLQYMQIQTRAVEYTMINDIWSVIKLQSQIKQPWTKRFWCASKKRIRPKKFNKQIYNCQFV